MLSSPKKPKTKRKPVTTIDSFVETAIRNVIYEMYANSKFINIDVL